MSSLVSIIIPTYNRAHLLAETLDSVLQQKYENWECLVIDDGSTDYTSELLELYIEKDSRFNFYQRPSSRSKGANACRNVGIEKSAGLFLLFLDSDDLLNSSCLLNRVNYFNKNPEKDFIIFSMGKFSDTHKQYIDENRSIFYFRDNFEYIDKFIQGPLPWNITRPIFKRSFLTKTDGFDEELLRFQDVEFNIRILYLYQPNFSIIDQTDCYYRIGQHQNIKYHHKVFQNLICIEFCKFIRKTIDLLRFHLTNYRKALLLESLITVIKNYSNTYSSFKSIAKLIFFYHNTGIIDFNKKNKLLTLLFFNSFWKYKKGYHKISQRILKDF